MVRIGQIEKTKVIQERRSREVELRNFDEFTITDAVIKSFANTRDPRVKQVSEALVRHLHDFIREIEPTEAEWAVAINFLTRTGQMCNEVRQEWFLMSDALGVSILVDAINHRLPDKATETTILGPFHVDRVALSPNGATINGPEVGPPLLIEGSVKDIDGRPIIGATVSIWHCDEDGYYDVQKNPNLLSCRGNVKTDEKGDFWVFGSIPSPYPIQTDGPTGQMLEAQGRHPYRPAHVHFRIEADGFKTLITHLFLAGSAYLDSDVVFAVKDSLIEELERAAPGISPYGATVATEIPALRRAFVLAR